MYNVPGNVKSVAHSVESKMHHALSIFRPDILQETVIHKVSSRLYSQTDINGEFTRNTALRNDELPTRRFF